MAPFASCAGSPLLATLLSACAQHVENQFRNIIYKAPMHANGITQIVQLSSNKHHVAAVIAVETFISCCASFSTTRPADCGALLLFKAPRHPWQSLYTPCWWLHGAKLHAELLFQFQTVCVLWIYHQGLVHLQSTQTGSNGMHILRDA